MQASTKRLSIVSLLFTLLLIPACGDRGELVRISKDRDAMRVERDRLKRNLEGRRQRIAGLERQVRNLRRFDAERPAQLFAPVKIEIVGRSGGANYDDIPGDDGVTVYIRPLDADGHVVKVPGELKVQLLDNTQLGRPRVLGYCVFNDPRELRKMWYGRFGTNHYTAKCRFAPGQSPPVDGRVMVSVEFTDFMTGKTLTAHRDVEVSPRE